MTDDPLPSPANSQPAPEPSSLFENVLYGASLPERLARGMIGAASGILRESAQAVVPDAMKASKLYQIAVEKILRRLVEDIGGLRSSAQDSSTSSASVAQMAVSNAVDVAGLATLHLSPLWILAIVSDAALGVRTYFQALVKELKAKKVIEGSATIDTVDDLLGSIQGFSGAVAERLDTPPLTLEELGHTARQLRSETTRTELLKLLPAEEIDRIWREIHETAAQENLSVFQISTAMGMMALDRLTMLGKGAVGSVKVGFDLLDDNVLDYYRQSLEQLREKGFHAALAEIYEPYLKALRHLFEPSTPSYTEKMLRGKLWKKACDRLRSWFRRPWRLRGEFPRNPENLLPSSSSPDLAGSLGKGQPGAPGTR